tara:strand:+ start:375 stop:773 length:399 start_codon:yes stop_codon:yes gene_type:complete
VCPRSRPPHRKKNYIKFLVGDFVNPLDVAWSVLKAEPDENDLSHFFQGDSSPTPPLVESESPFTERRKTPAIQGSVTCPVCGERQDYSWKVTQSTPNYTSGGCEHPEGEQALKDDYYDKLADITPEEYAGQV